MTKDNKENITHIDNARIKKLKKKGNLVSMIEEFERLKLKLIYDQEITKDEALRLVTLCKYLSLHGPNENFRYACELFYKKYIEKFDL